MATASLDTSELEGVVQWLLTGQARKSRGMEILNALRVKNGKAELEYVANVEKHDHADVSAAVSAVIADISAAS